MIVTCRYRLGKSLQSPELQDLLFVALSRVTARHAALCCSILDEETEEPAFGLLQSIDLRDVVTFIQLEGPDYLAHHLEQLHDERWTNLERLPAWKLVIFRHADADPGDHVDIVFVFHHGLADGLSGAAFHRSLLHELRDTTSSRQEDVDVPKVIDVSRSTQLTDPLEALVQLPLSWGFLAGQIFREYGPRRLFGSSTTLWAGARRETLEKIPYRSRLRILSIPADTVEKLLNAARSEAITLTSVITATLVVVLADLLPAAERFVGTTPYTMRRVCGTSMDTIVNQTSGFETSYSKSLLAEIRTSSKSFPHSTSRIWKVARYFHNNLKTEIGRAPKDNPVGMLPYISNYHKFCQGKLSQQREVTFEVSNLGLFNPANHGDNEDQEKKSWTIEDILFSQGAQVLGSAFAVNCASVRGGSLNLAFSWQEGVVDESFIDTIVREFEHMTSQL